MKNMLFLLTLFCLASLPTAYASHSAGAELNYRYIGDSTNIPHHYEITLVLYRQTQGATFGTTQPVEVNSSCFGSNTLNLQKFTPTGSTPSGSGGVTIPYFSECADSSVTLSLIETYHYRTDVVLQGQCSDFVFSWSICCRNNGIINLASSGSYNVYIEARLNNMWGPNSSPVIKTPGAKAFCIGYEMRWPQVAVETDGDSLNFELAQPLSDATTAIPWGTGFSASNPMSTSGPILFNPNNGNLVFTPLKQEVGVLKVKVEEYRKDSLGTPHLIGSTERDIQYVFTSQCDTSANKVNLSPPNLSGNGPTELNCGDQFIELEISSRVECSSIAPDGSDFALFNSLGNLVPIAAAGTDNCSDLFTQSIWIQLHDSIYYNDSLHLVTRLGNDLNTLLTVCGSDLEENDSLGFYVQSCSTSVNLDRYQTAGFSLYPNPAKEHLQIRFLNASGNRQVQILNLQGKVLREISALSQNNKIRVSHLPKGLYIIRSTEGEHQASLKFQKL